MHQAREPRNYSNLTVGRMTWRAARGVLVVQRLPFRTITESGDGGMTVPGSRNVVGYAWWCLAVLLSAMVVSTPCSAGESLRLGGTGASLGLMQVLGEAFERSNPDVKVEVVPSLGSSGGIKAAAKGAIDIAFSSRPLTAIETDLNLTDTEWVRTPFVVASGKETEAGDMSLPRLEQIYSGVVTSWPNRERIRLVLRPAAESDTRIAKSISPTLTRAIDSLSSLEGALIAVTDQENLATLAKIPGSLGFATLAQVITEKRPVQIWSFAGVPPSVQSLKDGSYSLVKPLYMITRPAPSANVKNFLAFLRTDQARSILTNSGAASKEDW